MAVAGGHVPGASTESVSSEAPFAFASPTTLEPPAVESDVSDDAPGKIPEGLLIVVGGLVAGTIIGFLMRPSVFLIGQLPFDMVISRGGNLSGLDLLLVPAAQRSFNIMLAGSIVGLVVGWGIRYAVKRAGR